MDSWKCQTRHKRIGVANEAPKKGCGLNGDAIKRASGGDHHTARTNGVDEMTFFMETTFWLFVNDMPSIEDCDEATAERFGSSPRRTSTSSTTSTRPRRTKRTCGGGPHHQVGVDQAPRGHPGVRAVGVRGVRDHAARGAAAILETSAKYLEDDNVDAKIQALFDPADPDEYVLVKDFNAAVKRGHQHELGEPQREVGGLGVQEARRRSRDGTST